jgi:hypothetical protein
MQERPVLTIVDKGDMAYLRIEGLSEATEIRLDAHDKQLEAMRRLIVQRTNEPLISQGQPEVVHYVMYDDSCPLAKGKESIMASISMAEVTCPECIETIVSTLQVHRPSDTCDVYECSQPAVVKLCFYHATTGRYDPIDELTASIHATETIIDRLKATTRGVKPCG